MAGRRERDERNADPGEWTPRRERRLWPWVLLVVIAVGVVVNVALTV
ncbi:hypothetical protein [Plantactinospora sp. GCM10030261]